MNRTLQSRLIAFLLCLAMVITLLPVLTFAETDDTESDNHTITMTAGDVLSGFAPEGSVFESSDPSIAWVDDTGNLKALKAGTVTISAVPSVSSSSSEYTVNVSEYSDGSDVVGQLKLQVRYNDSMQFYDGHVCLVFTSYQDGTEISIEDPYGIYEISDQYYADIRNDISNGSNHTGSETDQYFTFHDDLNSLTLNRGEVVSIGMYRDFDLTVLQAGIGTLKNSSAWTEIEASGKSAVIETFFNLLSSRKIDTEAAVTGLIAIFKELGLDYHNWIDGDVTGGICFNRELYNQKLEWDQFENVTYELDITRNQLNTLLSTLNNHLNNFSLFDNSCATIALAAWNTAIGTRNGVDTAYKLVTDAEGIYALFDVPKTIRDAVVRNLPGYYLNNAQGVAEPDAGFQDETGYVYVTAPEKVSPVTYSFDAEDTIQIDLDRTNPVDMVNAAKAGTAISYSKDSQDIAFAVQSSQSGSLTTVSGINFTINGTTVTADSQTPFEGGVWLKTKLTDVQEGAHCYVTDTDGNVYPSVQEDGWISFCADAFPVVFEIQESTDGTQNQLVTTIVNGEAAQTETLVYIKNGDEAIALPDTATLASGTKVYVKPALSEQERDSVGYILSDISLNGTSIKDQDHYDSVEKAFCFEMPEDFSKLDILYENSEISLLTDEYVQVSVGDTLNVKDAAELLIGKNKVSSDSIVFSILKQDSNEPFDYAADSDQKQIAAKDTGIAKVEVQSTENPKIAVSFTIISYENTAEMVPVTFDESLMNNLVFFSVDPDTGSSTPLLFSGVLVEKGSSLNVWSQLEDGQILSDFTVNGKTVSIADDIIINEASEIGASFRDAYITGVPNTISMTEKGETYQLKAEVKYSGVIGWFLPVYNPKITYSSSSSLVEVDENGLITVVGDIPEDGKAVIISAVSEGNSTVRSECKVILGNYKGNEIVGSLTISARRIYEGELIAHGCMTFTSYHDLDMDVSYYDYFRPNEKYSALMQDYKYHPENYPSDPALYSEEIQIENRESYFDNLVNGSKSDPSTISLKAGESFTFSNYGYDSDNITTLIHTLEGSTLAENSEEALELVNQMRLFYEGKEYDKPLAFDSLIAVLLQMSASMREDGTSTADNTSPGGIAINRELYNQFRRNDSQMPNNYHTVEITADELAILEAFLADPANNQYSLFNQNCAAGVVSAWNTVFADKPELHLYANYTTLAIEPESLYFSIGLMNITPGVEGCGGSNFYPRCVAYEHDHQYGDWTVTKEATCIEKGIRERTCSVCGNTESEEIDFAAHNYEISCDWTEDYSSAEITLTCKVCQNTVTEKAEISSKVLDPEKGIVEYTATIVVDGTAYSKTIVVEHGVPAVWPFEDVSETDWFFESVKYAYENGMIKGTDETHFSPYDGLQRQDFAVILCRTAGEPKVTYSADAFLDVSADDYFTNAVMWAKQEGVISGYDDGRFGVGDPITREQLATILFRYAEKLGADVSSRSDLTVFTDAASISSWAKDAISWCVANGIISGKENGTKVDPQGTAARAEAAKMLSNFHQKFLAD